MVCYEFDAPCQCPASWQKLHGLDSISTLLLVHTRGQLAFLGKQSLRFVTFQSGSGFRSEMPTLPVSVNELVTRPNGIARPARMLDLIDLPSCPLRHGLGNNTHKR